MVAVGVVAVADGAVLRGTRVARAAWFPWIGAGMGERSGVGREVIDAWQTSPWRTSHAALEGFAQRPAVRYPHENSSGRAEADARNRPFWRPASPKAQKGR
ncbi:hypothetical protein XFF6991_180366 [Xanthomonas phaseoli pv. phaseoli]|uniref:Uncharacterized protein n=1 Tax=Xanthomonas campestris pv. phaseoli TaxID=317013 RepID=A0A7Z7IX65_XANCH|nr:hypothetical protein XFF6991_180366 [Xanthomonas phaseoli pv. phaseoli]